MPQNTPDNTTNTTIPFHERLQSLRQSYIQQLPDKLCELETIWQAIHQGSGYDAEPFETLYRVAHSLAGSSATYGLDTLSETLRSLEALLQEVMEQASSLTDEQRASIGSLVGHVRATCTHYQCHATSDALAVGGRQYHHTDEPSPAPPQPAVPPQTQPTTPPAQQCTSTSTASDNLLCFPAYYDDSFASLVVEPMALMDQDNRLIFLLEDDSEQARDLAFQIGHFGYVVHVFDYLDDMQHALEYLTPAAIIMDILFPQGEMADMVSLASIPQIKEHDIPVMFISARNDVQARLGAVRAGGRAYFAKPINVSALIDRLDDLTTRKEPEPYRILIVDDDPILCSYYQLVLNDVGMQTMVVANPMNVLSPLADFRPDLILMDVYMPGCTGLELAAVLRQQDVYDGIPIVFLSTETDIEKQLRAMHLGGDDFLTKPIKPGHLVSAVTSRAQRSRVLRASMVRDSLTGLLNHTTLKERLQREVMYARRRHTPLAFAMIDLDHFKLVNDTYGHPTGDRVIKSLSRVLQQRLRQTDVVGRYGGEEFAVMMPDTDGTNAARVLDEIRLGFSQVRQRTESGDFSVTFSCGVTDFPSYDDAAVINRVADEALYEAKRGGRNRVILATR